jgi:uncharacterized phiE125 gp8 family phage protein
MAVIDVEEIKAWLGSGLDNTSEDDDVLVALEERVVAHVENLTGRRFSDPTEVLEIHNGSGRNKIWLRNVPVDNVISSVETRTSIGDAWTELDSTYYEAKGRRLYRTDGSQWVEGVENIRIRYEAGYPEAPGDIRQAILEIIESTWHNRVTATPALVTEQTIDIPRTAGIAISRWKVISGSGSTYEVVQ